ncbi:ribosomal large subunit pseudouridine synthase D [Magnetococcus marinus MC-1]|uniref:Pseudouridine synthase n=1 Tax=Magnetococcus marinus (strain ATCC BAA-1437 / JCM 17883 / MC-1) TaxID=156889 RepID=A0L9J0_MAGMM|nr:RluA family pseudouridine synthase [Magnetococcus marinus]ABK44633.1 ribosomal large subunit pseudouridine synthase D [Magnetococcus marinus MC-1]
MFELDETAPLTTLLHADDAGQRLDKALCCHFPDLTRSTLQRWIKEERVIVDHEVAKLPSQKVRVGQHIIIYPSEPEPSTALPEEIALEILFEDEHLIVLNKPAGMVVHPGAGVNHGTLVNALLYHCGTPDNPHGGLSGIGGVIRPGIVHRLDKETSGIMVAAKQDHAHIHLSRQFEQRTIGRRYLALTRGIPQPAQGRIEGAIGRHPIHRTKMAVVEQGGRAAATRYKVLEPLGQFALIRCRLESGRTHQIRVHMTHIGHPLVGDPLYGAQHKAPSHWPPLHRQRFDQFQRQALHAHTLTFIHPHTGEEMSFKRPPPADFRQLYETLAAMAQ